MDPTVLGTLTAVPFGPYWYLGSICQPRIETVMVSKRSADSDTDTGVDSVTDWGMTNLDLGQDQPRLGIRLIAIVAEIL